VSRRLFWPTLTAALAVLVLALAPRAHAQAPPPLCSTTGSPAFSFDLAGQTWKFRTGDDLAWLAPDFDDSSWQDRVVPDDWNTTAESRYDGFAWYRIAFTLPERPAGMTDAGVIASLGFIDDADTTYLNGTAIGSTGGFPPSFDSAWDEPREYYPPDGLLKWGARNVIAVRMYDGTGGGGFYKGPIGLFSKATLRELNGLHTTPASEQDIAQVCDALTKQHQALAQGGWPYDAREAYLRTLDNRFLHSGDDLERRRAEIKDMLAQYATVELKDDQTEVVRDDQGHIVVDTIRSWIGHTADGGTEVIYPPTRQFLYFDPQTGLELGDHSRFFRDSYRSTAMHGLTNFDVYLPPSYTTTTERRYPVVYMLHGINGSNVEWEVRGMSQIMDSLIRDKGIAEMIVIFPNGSSGWWVDSSAGNYRSMIVDEMVPLVDRVYRTIPDRDHRGISGVSMGGLGSFSIGLEHPELFSSIASHIGALNLTPLVGTPAERQQLAKLNPYVMVGNMTTEQLLAHTYYFDAGEQDDFGFYNAARQMDARLTEKGVPHEWQLGPGRHADSYWVPKLDRSFGLHTRQFAAHPYQQEPEPATSVSVNVDVSGSAPATLSLTLGQAASFGPFTPGLEKTYTATAAAEVTSTAGDAALTVSDPSTTAPGHLVNGALALPQPLLVGTSPLPATAKTWSGPTTHEPVAIAFNQAIGAGDALRTGTYAKTLTFTLSTTHP
jgi:enterochelin esterase-like enzyme